MDVNEASTIFDSFAHATRLSAFRLLVQAGPKGLAEHILSKKLGISRGDLSFHLKHLLNSGIISSRKWGSSVIYTANTGVMRDLIGFLEEE